MPILAASRRAVKLLPLAPTHRPVRPFGEGLTIEPIPAPAPIVVEMPAPAPAPLAKPSRVSRLDAAWHSGYCLGADGVDAAPCQDWPAEEKAAFLDGFAWGQEQRDADLEATVLDELDKAEEWARAMEMAEMPNCFAAMYA